MKDDQGLSVAEAMYYLRDLPFNEWIQIDDVPKEISYEVIDLIDEGYRWQYDYCEFGWSFRKRLKDEFGIKPKGNDNPKDRFGNTLPKEEYGIFKLRREPKIII